MFDRWPEGINEVGMYRRILNKSMNLGLKSARIDWNKKDLGILEESKMN